MIRLATITTFAVLLLLGAAPVFSQPYATPNETPVVAASDVTCSPSGQHRLGQMFQTGQQFLSGQLSQAGQHFQSGQMLHSGQTVPCPIPGHQHAHGTTCPLLGHIVGTGMGDNVSQRLGYTPPAMPYVRQSVPTTLPMPTGPAPNGFFGGMFTPQRYQQTQPIVPAHLYAPPGFANAYNPHAAIEAQNAYLAGVAQGANMHDPQAVANAHYAYLASVAQGANVLNPHAVASAQGAENAPNPHAASDAHVAGNTHSNAYAAGYAEGFAYAQNFGYDYAQGYGYPLGYTAPMPDVRIVYVPYAMPPPIYVERLAKGLPRLPSVRRLLGDANMYEYPEMPLQLYGTRGPRDFTVNNPPGIGGY